MNCSTPDLPVHHQLLEFTQIHVHRVGDAIQPSHPLPSPSPPAPNPSQHQGLFQWVSSLNEVAKVLESRLQHQSFQWTPGLISFRMNWLDLLCIQGTLKSLLQHQSSKASILWRSAFFTVQLSHSHKFLWDKYYLYFSLIDAETKAQKGKVIFPDLHNSALRGVLLIQLCIGEWMHLEIGRAGDEYFYPHYHLVIKWPPECIQTWTKCNLFKDDFVHLPDKLGNVKLVVSF